MKTIKVLREERGLTQRELAAKLDVTVTSVSGWERRAHGPTAMQLRKLGIVFGVPMDEIEFWPLEEGKDLAA